MLLCVGVGVAVYTCTVGVAVCEYGCGCVSVGVAVCERGCGCVWVHALGWCVIVCVCVFHCRLPL